jgi:hypothetical protein
MLKVTQKYIFLLFLVIFIHNYSYAQKTKILEQTADSLFNASDYSNAQTYLVQLYEKDSTKKEITYKLGLCFLKQYQPQQAQRYFGKLINDANPINDYLYFNYGLSLKANGKYKEAKKYFEKSFKKYKKKNNELEKESLHESTSCDSALAISKRSSSKNYPLKDIGKIAKDYKSFYNPIIIDSLVTATALADSNIFEKELVSINYLTSKISNPVFLNSILTNLPKNQQINYICQGFNENEFFATILDNTNNEKSFIYQIKLSDEGIPTYNELNKKINLEGSNSIHPWPSYNFSLPKSSTSNIKKVLYFSSDRKNGFGGYDIWQSELSADGNFLSPVNLGEKINSKGNELSPFFCGPCNHLYFSSDYHPGLGGFDIFFSKQENNSWLPPINLEMPINTNANELYFRKDIVNEQFIFASNRTFVNKEIENGCCNSIYMYSPTKDILYVKSIDSLETKPIAKIELPPTKIKKIEFLQQQLPLNLYFDNDEPNPNTNLSSTSLSYKDLNDKYFTQKNSFKKYYQENKLLNKEQDFIESYFNDSVVGNFKSLDLFLIELSNYLLDSTNSVKLSFKGFSSNLANSKYNKNLAARRISSLENYFFEWNNGILKNLILSGKLKVLQLPVGETETVDENDTGDKKFKVYSKEACLQRKIEITKVE